MVTWENASKNIVRGRERSFHGFSDERKNSDVNFPTFLQADFCSEVSLDEFVFLNLALQNCDVSSQNGLWRNRGLIKHKFITRVRFGHGCSH